MSDDKQEFELKPGSGRPEWATMDDPSTENIPIPEGILAKLPCSDDWSEKERAVMALKCGGFSNRAIARCFSMSPQTVTAWLQKIDPKGTYPALSARERRWILATLVEIRVGDALLKITNNKLDKLDANKLMQFVNSGLAAAKELGVQEEMQKQTVDSLVSKLNDK